MRRFFIVTSIFLAVGLMALASCQKKNEDSVDIRTFGLYGNVEKVMTTP